MLVIRPVAAPDLQQLVDLAHQTGFGLTTLPTDREFLRRRISKSLHSFAGMGESPSGESYLFVLEDIDSGKIVGTSGIVSKVGGFEPFYAYRIETTVHESAVLGVRKEIRVLHLVAEHNGPAEICSLFLHPQFRKGGVGRLLSLSRFLFMAQFSAAFEPVVLAEMRGVIDDRGGNPFWDALGKHFFEVDFPKADYLSLTNKRFIADLMPKYPIYIPLLPPEAQAVIGQVHDQTRPALRLLEEEGFAFSRMVDIFEGGPIVACKLTEVRTVSESRRAYVAEIGELSDNAAQAQGTSGAGQHLISNTRTDFRACLGTVETAPAGGVMVPRDCADALGVEVGDEVRYAPVRRASSARVPADATVPADVATGPTGKVSEKISALVSAAVAAAREEGT